MPTPGRAPEGNPDAQAQEGPPRWREGASQTPEGATVAAGGRPGQREQPESRREPGRTLGKAVAPCDFTGGFLETTPLHIALGGRSHGGRLLGAVLVAARVRTEQGQEGRPMGSGSGAEGLGRP